MYGVSMIASNSLCRLSCVLYCIFYTYIVVYVYIRARYIILWIEQRRRRYRSAKCRGRPCYYIIIIIIIYYTEQQLQLLVVQCSHSLSPPGNRDDGLLLILKIFFFSLPLLAARIFRYTLQAHSVYHCIVYRR